MSMVVFSGRFDPLHPGHIATMMRLSKKYDIVKMVILNHPERSYPASYIKQVCDEIFEGTNVRICINKTHFAELTLEEWNYFGGSVYAAGNLQVLKHIESLGIECIYVDRAYDFSASHYKRLD